MKNIDFFSWLLIVCVTFIFPGCIFHKPAYYPAQILIKDETPCFSVANNRETRANPPEISSINVFSYAGKEMVPIWSQVFDPDQPAIKLSPHACIPYGSGVNFAPPLKHKFRYGISIFSSINGDDTGHQSYFCLYETPDGKTAIHHAEWNYKVHERDWGVCEK